MKISKIVDGRTATFTFPRIISWHNIPLTFYRAFTNEREAKSMRSQLDNDDFPATVRTETTRISNPRNSRKPLFRQIFVVYRASKRRKK